MPTDPPLSGLAGIPAPVLAALTAAVTALGSWLTLRKKTVTDTLAVENAEKAAFRASLMGNIQELRGAIKTCEEDRERIRGRLFTAEEQLIELKAAIKTMQRWVDFFKTRDTGPTREGSKPAPDGMS